IMQQLADTQPAATKYQNMLAWDHTLIGEALAEMGKPAEAMASQRRALAICEKVVEANPTDIMAQCGLAWTQGEIGELLAREGRSAEALHFYARARARIRQQAE